MEKVKVIIRDSKKTMKFEGTSALVIVDDGSKMKIINEGTDPLLMRIIIDRLEEVFAEQLDKVIKMLIDEDEIMSEIFKANSEEKSGFAEKIFQGNNEKMREFFSEMIRNDG